MIYVIRQKSTKSPRKEIKKFKGYVEVKILNFSRLLKKDNIVLVLMVVTVPLASELNFYPFNETFRISFAAPTFFFFLLLFRKIPVILPGFLTAILIVVFRIFIDLLTSVNFDWTASLQNQFLRIF